VGRLRSRSGTTVGSLLNFKNFPMVSYGSSRSLALKLDRCLQRVPSLQTFRRTFRQTFSHRDILRIDLTWSTGRPCLRSFRSLASNAA